MKIHKEGTKTVVAAATLMVILILLVYWLLPLSHWTFYAAVLLLLVCFACVAWFFRSPARHIVADRTAIISPADGKIISIEEALEDEVLNQPMMKLSVFMSPLNVHLNRVPADGKVIFYRYHPGKYLVAWHPKSSKLNEHNTIVIETPDGIRILLRQIAGAVARRIVCYCSEGKEVKQGEELGFIKFGSRVDLYLPVTSKLLVQPGDKVVAGITTLANIHH